MNIKASAVDLRGAMAAPYVHPVAQKTLQVVRQFFAKPSRE
jgi:hypothetical protein